MFNMEDQEEISVDTITTIQIDEHKCEKMCRDNQSAEI